jgi:starch-binding outer membrane protein, SusD/RagB family
MAMKAFNPRITAALLLLAVVGCTDLTVEPKSTVTSANIFTDPAAYKQFLAKLYAGLAVSGQAGPAGNADIQGIDEGFSQYVRLYWQMEEFSTDEAVIAWNDAGVQELNTQLWSSSNQFLGAMYSRVFFQVSLVNEFLRQTTDAQLASRGHTGQIVTDVHQFRAEARFLRALSYWHGMDLFGNIPLVKETDPIGSTPPKQSTRADIYAYIESELKAIRGDLPPGGTGQYGRADQGAVDMLLAKLYQNAIIYIGQDQSAAALAAAQSVINTPAYRLDPNYRHMFQADNNTSPEIIFAIPQDGVHTQSFGGTTFLVHASVGGSMDPNAIGIDGGWYGTRARPELVALFAGGAGGPDGRSAVFFTVNQALNINDLMNFNDGYGVNKYENVTSAGVPGQRKDFVDTDYPMFRLGDAYLIYAESALRGSPANLPQALIYVNALRTRAYGNTNGNITAAQLTLSFVLDERARELFWEGVRRTDLIRYNRLTDNGVWQWKGGIQAGKTTEAFRNLFPLPSSELLANPNLKQNTGY